MYTPRAILNPRRFEIVILVHENKSSFSRHMPTFDIHPDIRLASSGIGKHDNVSSFLYEFTGSKILGLQKENDEYRLVYPTSYDSGESKKSCAFDKCAKAGHTFLDE